MFTIMICVGLVAAGASFRPKIFLQNNDVKFSYRYKKATYTKTLYKS